MAHPSRAFLDDIAATVPIDAHQSAAIVATIAGRLDRWIVAAKPVRVAVPDLCDVALHRDGHLWWFRGRSLEPREVVPALGAMLNALLEFHQGTVPGGLRYIVARATDPRHLAPFGSVHEFTAALARHAPDAMAQAIDSLLARFLMASSGHPALSERSTISDVRRLRRAGGIPLPRIAEDTGIPLSLLRELEWGVFVNWDPGHTSQSLEAYARRAGLDARSVTHIVRREVVGEELVTVSAVPAHQEEKARFAPYALVAALLLTVLALAPQDRMVPAFSAAQATSADVSESAPVVRPATTKPESPANQRVVPHPRETTAVPASRKALAAKPPKPSARIQPTSRALSASTASRRPGRFARAILGDGRYKVEPFPRVQ